MQGYTDLRAWVCKERSDADIEMRIRVSICVNTSACQIKVGMIQAHNIWLLTEFSACMSAPRTRGSLMAVAEPWLYCLGRMM